VGTTLVAGQGVDLVEDERPHRPQQLASRGRGQQDIKRLGRSHQDMRRQTAHPLALGLAGIAGAHPGANFYRRQAPRRQLVRDSRQRPLQIELDVGGQGLQGRHIEHSRPVGEALLQTLTQQAVDNGKESRQGLARTGGRRQQRMSAACNGRPGRGLDRARRLEAGPKPDLDGRVKQSVAHRQPALEPETESPEAVSNSTVADARTGSGAYRRDQGPGRQRNINTMMTTVKTTP